MPRFNPPCKKRSRSRCRSAKKSCKMALGIKRKYCRTRKNKSAMSK